MFLCEDCTHPDDKWWFDIPMSVSRGPCENCKFTRNCIDHKGARLDPNWKKNLEDTIAKVAARRANA